MANSTLLDKLEGLVSRFEEVSTLVTDPAVIADQQRFVKLTREYKELEDILAARKEYKSLLDGVEEAKMMMGEEDAELKEMARQQLADCEARLPEMEEKIKLPVMPCSKSVAVRVATRRLSLLAISSRCTSASASLRAGRWLCRVPLRAPWVVSRKSSAW